MHLNVNFRPNIDYYVQIFLSAILFLDEQCLNFEVSASNSIHQHLRLSSIRCMNIICKIEINFKKEIIDPHEGI